MKDEKSLKSVHLSSLLEKGLEHSEKYATSVSDLRKKIGEEVFLRGWVYRHRRTGNMAFVVLRDGTGIVQCSVNKDNVKPDEWESANDLYIDSVVNLIGEVREDDRAPDGIEVQVREFGVAFKGEPFPITKDQSTEFLLDMRHLWIRSPKMIDILKLKASVINDIRGFLDEKGFLEVQPPLITGSAAEGGATLFEVNYFDRKAYLSQSGQLYLEAVINGYPLVYGFAPSFRAEPSRTPRHLAEFWQLEAEMAFYNQDMNMKLQEQILEHVAHSEAKNHPDILKRFGRDPQDLLDIQTPFERMKYEKALDILKEKGLDVKWSDGLGMDEEKALMQDRKQPVFLTNQPKEIRAFYMRINPDDPRTVLDADLLAPEGIGEIFGGSERVSDYDELMGRIKEQNLKEEDYQWYIDLRKYGSIPHSGFGIGSERVVRWILKLDSIRDAIPFPRTMNRISP
ncbi:asparaginyl-tRNA synthetase [Candidatus Mancarchaeum acidiphilum]|uniref:Asparagine--tRNA ligase n=1 Tax=Candidatus Mancarchaeum acidiphilum TaxID=1920749 RepID=A0A218NMF4_9ARCH|nr:asparagine--tRNA ligase [Candidatus Mancarchaeum acidiphilum]ASI13646.1 asparaginyl-tRNA synthetase [Candidatus Mancarchaeum acidiphilum]